MSENVVIREPYELSVWLDELIPEQESTWDGGSGIVLEHYEERKVAIIGANDMDTPFAAHNPNLVLNVNGSVTLTFEMFYRCFDEWYGVEGDFRDNPYTSLLNNEAKVKFKFRDEWYDLLIKKVEENSENYTFKYTTSSFFINELSKNGFKVELDVELENNQGTVTDLALKIMKETDWIVDVENSDILVQTITEPIYAGFLSKDIRVEKVADYMPDPKQKDTVEDIEVIRTGERVYFFYSDLQAEAPQPLILYRPLKDWGIGEDAEKEAKQSTYYFYNTQNQHWYAEDYMVDLNKDVITNAFNYRIIDIINDDNETPDTIELNEISENMESQEPIKNINFSVTYHGEDGKTLIPDIVQDTLENSNAQIIKIFKDQVDVLVEKVFSGKTPGGAKHRSEKVPEFESYFFSIYNNEDSEYREKLYNQLKSQHTNVQGNYTTEYYLEQMESFFNENPIEIEKVSDSLKPNTVYQQIGDTWFRTVVTDDLLFAPSNNFRGKKVIRSPRSTYDVNLEWPVTVYTRSDEYLNGLIDLDDIDREFEPNKYGYYVKVGGRYIFDKDYDSQYSGLTRYSKKEYYGYIHTEDYSPNLTQNYLANSYDYANIDTGWVFDGTPSTQDDLANGKVNSEEDGAFTGQIYYLNSMNFQLDPSVETAATSVLEMRLKNLQNERFYKDSTGKYFKNVSHILTDLTEDLENQYFVVDNEIIKYQSVFSDSNTSRFGNLKTIIRYIEADSATVEALRETYLNALKSARTDPQNSLYESYNGKTDEELEQIADRIISDQRYSKSPRVAINTGVAANRDTIKTLNKGEQYIFAISLGRYKEGEQPPEYKKDSISYGSSPPDARYKFVPEEEGDATAFDYAVKEFTEDYQNNPLKYYPSAWQPGGELYQREYNKAYEEARQQYLNVFYDKGLKGSLDARFRRIGGKNKQGTWQIGAWNNGSIIYRTLYRKAITDTILSTEFWQEVIKSAAYTYLADDNTYFDGKIYDTPEEINKFMNTKRVIEIFKYIETPLIPTLLLSDTNFEHKIIIESSDELDDDEKKIFSDALTGYSFKRNSIFKDDVERTDGFGRYIINEEEKMYVPPDFNSYNGDDISNRENWLNYRYPNYEDAQYNRILSALLSLIKSDYYNSTFSQLLDPSNGFPGKAKKAIRKAIRELWWDVESPSREKAASLEKSLMFPVWGALNHGGNDYQKWENWWQIYATEKAKEAANKNCQFSIYNQPTCFRFFDLDNNNDPFDAYRIESIDILTNYLDRKDQINIIQEYVEDTSSQTLKMLKFKDIYMSRSNLAKSDLNFNGYLNRLRQILDTLAEKQKTIDFYSEEIDKNIDEILKGYYSQKKKEEEDSRDRLIKIFNEERQWFDGFYEINPMYLKMLSDNDGWDLNLSNSSQLLRKKYSIDGALSKYFSDEANYHNVVIAAMELVTDWDNPNQVNIFYNALANNLTLNNVKLLESEPYQKIVETFDTYGGILNTQYVSDYLYLFTQWLNTKPDYSLDGISIRKKRNYFDAVLDCTIGQYDNKGNWQSISPSAEWPCTDEFVEKTIQWKDSSNNESLVSYSYKHMGGSYNIVEKIQSDDKQNGETAADKLLSRLHDKSENAIEFDGIMVPVDENFNTRKKDYYVLTDNYIPLTLEEDPRENLLKAQQIIEIDWNNFMVECGSYFVSYNNNFISLDNYWNARATEFNSIALGITAENDKRRNYIYNKTYELCNEVASITLYKKEPYFRHYDDSLDGTSEMWLATPNLDHSKGGSFFLENGDPVNAIQVQQDETQNILNLDYTAGHFRPFNEELDREYIGRILLDGIIGDSYLYDPSYELVPCYDGIGYYFPGNGVDENGNMPEWIIKADEGNEGSLFNGAFKLRQNNYQPSFIPHSFDNDNGEQLLTVIRSRRGNYVKTADIVNNFSEFWNKLNNSISNWWTQLNMNTDSWWSNIRANIKEWWYGKLNALNDDNNSWAGILVNDKYLDNLRKRAEKVRNHATDAATAAEQFSTWMKQGFAVDFILANCQEGSAQNAGVFYKGKEITGPFEKWFKNAGVEEAEQLTSYSGYYFNTRGNNKIIETDEYGNDIVLGVFEQPENDLKIEYEVSVTFNYEDHYANDLSNNPQHFSGAEIKAWWNDIKDKVKNRSAADYYQYYATFNEAAIKTMDNSLLVEGIDARVQGINGRKTDRIYRTFQSIDHYKYYLFNPYSKKGDLEAIIDEKIAKQTDKAYLYSRIRYKARQYYLKQLLRKAVDEIGFDKVNEIVNSIPQGAVSGEYGITRSVQTTEEISADEIYEWHNPLNIFKDNDKFIYVMPFTRWHWYQIRNWGKPRYEILPPLAAKRAGDKSENYHLLNKYNDLRQRLYTYIPKEEINETALDSSINDWFTEGEAHTLIDYDKELVKVKTDLEIFSQSYPFLGKIATFFKTGFNNFVRGVKKLTRSTIGTEIDNSSLHDYTENTLVGYVKTQIDLRSGLENGIVHLVSDNKDDYFTTIHDDEWAVTRYEPVFFNMDRKKDGEEICYYYDPARNYFRPYNRRKDSNWTLFDLKVGSNTPVFKFKEDPDGHWMYFATNDWYIPINNDRFTTPKRYKKVRDFDNGGYVLDNNNYVNFDGYMAARTKTFKLDYDNLEVSFCDTYNFDAINFAVDLTKANVPNGVTAATYDENKKKYLYFDCSKTDDKENFGYFDTTVVTDSIIDDKKTFERWVYWKAEVQENFSLTENLVNPIGMVFSSKIDKDYAFIGTQLFKYYPYYTDLTYQKTEINKEDSNEPEFAEDFVVKKMVIPGEIVDTDELSYQSYYIYDPDEMNNVDNITYEYVGPEPFDNGWAYDYDEKCQKVRSIKGKESNYFNLLQSLCETFECWVDFQVEHDPDTGQIVYRNTPIYIEKVKDEEGNYIDTPIEEEDEVKSLIQNMELTTQKYPYNCIEEIPIEVKKDFIILQSDLCDEEIPVNERSYTVAGYYNDFVQNYEGMYVIDPNDVTNYIKVEKVEDHAPMDRYSHLKKTDKQIEFEKRQKAIAFFEDEANAEKYFTKKYVRVPQKKIVFKEYVGKDNYAGFKYGVNLKSTKRNIDSAQFTSRIVVKPNNNKYAENKFCSIQRAQDNFLKENFFYNFDYYIQHGLLKNTDLINDLYSDNDKHLGYFTKLHFLNQDLDTLATHLADLMISIDKLEADYQTAALGRQSATEEIQKLISLIQGNYDTYGQLIDSPWTFNKSKQYVERAEKGVTTLAHDYDATFYINGIATTSTLHIPTTMLTVDYPKYNETLRTWFDEMDVYQNKYTAYYNAELKYKKQLDDRKAEKKRLEELQDIIVKKKTELNELFYHKYSRYIQEGSWTSNEYLDDNLYFLDALSVLRNSAFPKVSYQIGVVDLYPLEEYQVFDFRIGDRTYVEDTEFFGYIDSTGRPAQEEIVVTEISFFPEDPIKNAIKVQNYRTQFEDLFKRITAQSQQMKFNESNYGASSTGLLGGGAGLIGGNLVTNSGVTDIPNVTIENGKITLGKDGVELLLDGDSISFRRGDRIIQVASVRGTSADQLVGQLNLDTLTMGSSGSPGLKLDRLGLSAYAIQDDGTVNYGKFVRHDQYGLYGIDMGVTTRTINDTFTGGIDEIEDQASFALTWNGFMLRSGDRNNRVKIGTDTDIRMQVTEGSNWKDRLIIGRMTDKNNEEYYGFRILNNDNEVVMETEPDGELYLKRKLRIANFSPTYAAVDTDTLIQQTDENGDTTYIDPNPDARNLESRVNLGIVELFRRNITSIDGNRITTYTKEDTIPNYYDSATYLTKVLSIAANMETLDEEKAFEQFRDDQVREYETYVPYTPGVNDTTPLYIYNENLGYQPYVANNSLDTDKWETSETNETDESEVEIRESTEIRLYRKIEQTGLLAANETFALFDNGCLVAKNAFIEGNIRATTGRVGALVINKDGTIGTKDFQTSFNNNEANLYHNVSGFILSSEGFIELGNKGNSIWIDANTTSIFGHVANIGNMWELTPTKSIFKNVEVKGTLETAVFRKSTIQSVNSTLLLRDSCKIEEIVESDLDNYNICFNVSSSYFSDNHEYYFQIIQKDSAIDDLQTFVYSIGLVKHKLLNNEQITSIYFNLEEKQKPKTVEGLILIQWIEKNKFINADDNTVFSDEYTICINATSNSLMGSANAISLSQICKYNNNIELSEKVTLGRLNDALNNNGLSIYNENNQDIFGLFTNAAFLQGIFVMGSLNSVGLNSYSQYPFYDTLENTQKNDYSSNFIRDTTETEEQFENRLKEEKAVIWAGNNDDNYSFAVGTNGNVRINNGYFSGNIYGSEINASKINTAKIFGNNSQQFALTIFDNDKGIQFKQSENGPSYFDITSQKADFKIPLVTEILKLQKVTLTSLNQQLSFGIEDTQNLFINFNNNGSFNIGGLNDKQVIGLENSQFTIFGGNKNNNEVIKLQYVKVSNGINIYFN